jgi:hypothetical protein
LESVEKFLRQNSVISVTYARHMTNIFQILDLNLFRVFRVSKNRTEDIESQVNIPVGIAKTSEAIQESYNIPMIQAACEGPNRFPLDCHLSLDEKYERKGNIRRHELHS